MTDSYDEQEEVSASLFFGSRAASKDRTRKPRRRTQPTEDSEAVSNKGREHEFVVEELLQPEVGNTYESVVEKPVVPEESCLTAALWRKCFAGSKSPLDTRGLMTCQQSQSNQSGDPVASYPNRFRKTITLCHLFPRKIALNQPELMIHHRFKQWNQ